MAERVQSLGVKLDATPHVSRGHHPNVHNAILLGLPRSECSLVLSKSEFVRLPARSVLTEMGDPIEFCYFLNSSVVSIIQVMSDG